MRPLDVGADETRRSCCRARPPSGFSARLPAGAAAGGGVWGVRQPRSFRDEREGRRRGDDAVALDELHERRRLAHRAEPVFRRLQQTLAARRRGVEVGGDAGARVLQERRERRAAEALADAAARRGFFGLELLELGVGERLRRGEAELVPDILRGLRGMMR